MSESFCKNCGENGKKIAAIIAFQQKFDTKFITFTFSSNFQHWLLDPVNYHFTCSLLFSASFCFLRMTFAERQTAIEFGPGQREAFEYLIPPVYSLINWIPLDDSQEGKPIWENRVMKGSKLDVLVKNQLSNSLINGQGGVLIW